MKVAVVTPYYKESDATLRRCIDSVAAQTHPDVRHYMVADGFPRPDLTAGVDKLTPINLPSAHGDYGCTPRSVGGLCALNEGADIVCFLDADNLYQPEHVASLVSVYQEALKQGETLDAVFAYRHVFLPGNEHLRLEDQEDLARNHVDTSCISFARSAAFMWIQWGMIPPSWTPICDRVMFDLVKINQLKTAWTGQHTVLYESNWSIHYRLAGLPVPAEGLHDGTVQKVGKLAPEEIYARLRLKPMG
ncbi:MAG: glycosyltransferase [Rhodocyclaceae bacterium]|jgi:glycosyltransferase involved in cell wall biosynthesis|nr:glycosyltransferase [Rhodocyclaceae bacterium]